MNPGESQRMLKDYLKRIESALAAVDHPRRAEVLADVRAHVEEKQAAMGSDADLQRIIDEMGSPEEYAEGLAPEASAQRPRKWKRRQMLLIAIGSVLLLFAWWRLALSRQKNNDARYAYGLKGSAHFRIRRNAS